MPREGLGETQKWRVRRQLRPGSDGASAQRQARVAKEDSRVGTALKTQSFAGRAPAKRAVERKVMRVQPLEGSAAAVAGEVLAIAVHFPLRLRPRVIDMGDVDDALAQF